MERIDHLRREIALRESELADLRSQLAVAESEHRAHQDDGSSGWKWPLAQHEYDRYSRQMIVPKLGLESQLKLKNSRVLVIGAGGLGCPASAYLAGAGVGALGLVDGDTVEVSNLHRQIAHSTSRVGMSKVESAITYLQELNPTIKYHAHQTHLTTENAQGIVSQYDFVLDCTDHPTSRYLISDICTLLSKPLISASAFQSSGQLIVLNNPPGQGPCYRCVFPKPPPPESVVACGEGGIIGPVVGVMGVLQALEAIKVITQEVEQKGDEKKKTNTLLLFSALSDTPFRSVRMRGRRSDCVACGDASELTLEKLKSSMDYVQFCGVKEPVKLLKPDERITAEEYARIAKEQKDHVLIDVREKEQFGLCSIPGSINIPITRFMSHRPEKGQVPEWFPEAISPSSPVYLVCRVGNDSQTAAQKLKDMGLGQDGERFIGDISGGLSAWRNAIDPSIPFI
ncbi:unnamed protein product [Clonostachys byssicola]|uniref:Adenylyltransferase and sulfurtransferase uba4 n=1 Tax=Clonostachys byssicola TaxID=160290 RepID=A0A9N9U2M3_9HYPO|nr:unnamed protein product [Clonostachys byssicola]